MLRTAGPERPPVAVASTGRFCSMSIARPESVFMMARACAPASATAVATGRMSVTFGVSLTINGSELRSLTACVTAPAMVGSVPKSSPWATLGQEMFSSNAAIPGTPSSISAIVTYSSNDAPATLAMTGTSHVAQSGALSRIKASTPTFCKPMALSMPPGTSAIRGIVLPLRGSSVTAFAAIAPRQFTS